LAHRAAAFDPSELIGHGRINGRFWRRRANPKDQERFGTGLSKLLPSMLEGNPDAPLIVERVYYTREAD
jgi:hypothetical protein